MRGWKIGEPAVYIKNEGAVRDIASEFGDSVVAGVYFTTGFTPRAARYSLAALAGFVTEHPVRTTQMGRV